MVIISNYAFKYIAIAAGFLHGDLNCERTSIEGAHGGVVG
jgi:hypothetical protein